MDPRTQTTYTESPGPLDARMPVMGILGVIVAQPAAVCAAVQQGRLRGRRAPQHGPQNLSQRRPMKIQYYPY